MNDDLFSHLTNPVLLNNSNLNQKTISQKSLNIKKQDDFLDSKSANSSQAKNAFSVSELNFELANLLAKNFKNIWVYGEIINFSVNKGHWYFSIRDEKSQINCVMFKSRNAFLAAPIKNGMLVFLKASPEVYSVKGSLQLIVEGLKFNNEGDILKNLEVLKQKLLQEGIFDKPKKPLPKYAKNIALLTSNSGAVILDIKKVFEKNWQLVNLFVFDVGVQGFNAVDEICTAFEFINLNSQNFDLIFLARGGGSETDLAIFNDEKIIRAIYNSKLPVLSAIGHATDSSLADLISDFTATTPTAGAEKICDGFLEFKNLFLDLQKRLDSALKKQFVKKFAQVQIQQNRLNLIEKLKISGTDFLTQKQNFLLDKIQKNLDFKQAKIHKLKAHLQISQLKLKTDFLQNKLDSLKAKLYKATPLSAIRVLQNNLNLLQKNLQNETLKKIEIQQNLFLTATTKLDAVSPLKVLSRGFALVTDEQTNSIIKDANTVKENQILNIRLAQGSIKCKTLKNT